MRCFKRGVRMRKIVSYKVVAMYLFLSIIFAAICLTTKNPNGFFMNVIFLLSFVLSGCFLALPFAQPNYILFDFAAGRVEILNCPILSTNKTRAMYGSLISYNDSVLLDEVDYVEVVRLTNAQKTRLIGHKHIFSRYLKIHMKHSASQKYIYISIYSKSQVRKIIKFLTVSKAQE